MGDLRPMSLAWPEPNFQSPQNSPHVCQTKILGLSWSFSWPPSYNKNLPISPPWTGTWFAPSLRVHFFHRSNFQQFLMVAIARRSAETCKASPLCHGLAQPRSSGTLGLCWASIPWIWQLVPGFPNHQTRDNGIHHQVNVMKFHSRLVTPPCPCLTVSSTLG